MDRHYIQGGIFVNKAWIYWFQCAKIEAKKYDEPYIHHERQLQGLHFLKHALL
ncbi:hypothetical protein [Bacillus cereus]|uniref:hypothetical protein n=1 Tax=Bacillus cereus TaxID=1396 RepID=UPI0015D5ABC4|nr:hypothetical protein [Bacillus cereus]MCH5460921.1 hypothetical protein [Bacillus cereus]